MRNLIKLGIVIAGTLSVAACTSSTNIIPMSDENKVVGIEETKEFTTLAAKPKTKCRKDGFTTSAANNFGKKLYDYRLDVNWCYDMNKAWVTNKYTTVNVYSPYVKFKGDTINVVGDKSRAFTVSAQGRFHSDIAIPTPFGAFGFNREAYPYVKLTGYYYGNVGIQQAGF